LRTPIAGVDSAAELPEASSREGVLFNDSRDARSVLATYRVVAVVGLSPKPDRPSYRVASFLQERGYTIVPINPTAESILGEKAYPSLRAVPRSLGIEVVEVFRRPEEVMPHVEEAIDIGAKVLWLQDGVVNLEAAERAAAAGLTVIMDRCMARDLAAMTARTE
jgi:predicted CoA-binding protein